MRYAILFFTLVLLEVILLQTLFKPGFLAPDIVLISLFIRTYVSGRSTLLWAILAGALLDLMTDTIGLNLSLEVLSVYLFILITEKFFFKSILTFVVPGGFLLLLKKILSLLMMRWKFSFEVSISLFVLSWFFELLILLGVYFLYLRRRE